MIGDPPVLVGAVHDSATWPSAGATFGAAGADGTTGPVVPTTRSRVAASPSTMVTKPDASDTPSSPR